MRADHDGELQRWAAIPASDASYVLGEGPVWDEPRQRLHWVDIESGTVMAGRLQDDRIEVVDQASLGGRVGCMAVARDGRVVAAVGHRLVVLEPGGGHVDGPDLIPPHEHDLRRLNDGKVDPAGRLLVGTAAFRPSRKEQLLQLRGLGPGTVLDDDLTLSNGLGWSVDGGLLYSIDTFARRVWRRTYDPGTGLPGPREPWVQVEDGYPDGMCVDAEDHCWVAIYGAGQVRRYAPDGTQVGVIDLPVPKPTSVAFAGPELNLLVITTTIEGMDAAARKSAPLSGHLFTARVGVRGAPVPPWNPEA